MSVGGFLKKERRLDSQSGAFHWHVNHGMEMGQACPFNTQQVVNLLELLTTGVDERVG